MATIYKIENIKSGKCYVGATVNFKKRSKQHFYNLRAGRHPNSRLQTAYDKYGEDSFAFVVLEEINSKDIRDREEYWHDKLKNETGVYNIRPIPESNSGYRHTEETKKKISNALKGRDPFTPEIRRQAAAKLKGQKKSQYVKDAISKAAKHLWATRREEMIWKCRKLTIENIQWAHKQKSNGISQAQIARDLNVSAATICHMFKGNKYKEVVINGHK